MKRFQFTLRAIFALTAMVAVVFAVLHWKPWLSNEDRDYLVEAQRLDNTNVAHQVEDAFQRGDNRFIGVMEDALIVPGISEVIPVERLIILQGTSDAIRSKAHNEYCRAAHKYAEEYNRRLMLLIKSAASRHNTGTSIPAGSTRATNGGSSPEAVK